MCYCFFKQKGRVPTCFSRDCIEGLFCFLIEYNDWNYAIYYFTKPCHNNFSYGSFVSFGFIFKILRIFFVAHFHRSKLTYNLVISNFWCVTYENFNCFYVYNFYLINIVTIIFILPFDYYSWLLQSVSKRRSIRCSFCNCFHYLQKYLT